MGNLGPLSNVGGRRRKTTRVPFRASANDIIINNRDVGRVDEGLSMLACEPHTPIESSGRILFSFFGTSKHGCIENAMDIQIDRLKEFAEGWDDLEPVKFIDFQVLQALAARGLNKGIKRGCSLAAEVFKWLGMGAKLEIGKSFREYANKLQAGSDKMWRIVQSYPLKKESKPVQGKGFRWIGKTEEFQKWYLGCLVHYLDQHSTIQPVLSFGFRKDAMVEDVITIIREICHSLDVWGAAIAWNGSSLYIGSQDVETAFDTVNHEEEAIAMIHSGVPILAAAALVKQKYRYLH